MQNCNALFERMKKGNKDGAEKQKRESKLSSCEPAGARTQDPILKRDVLYLLSYWFSSRELRLNTIRNEIAHMNFRRVLALPKN